jgi:SAM-dependent methyltransferase
MSHEEIKDVVKDRYSRIATGEMSCCSTGTTSCGCSVPADAGTYVVVNEPYRNVDQHILSVADLGLGCGHPTTFADLKEGMTVLDLGSGAGIDVFIAAKQVGPTGRAIGLDMTDGMLAKANENKEKLGILNAEFRKGEIEQMPVETNSIDRVISNCVINLVPDKTRAFAEIFRVLKPGGSFTVSDIVSTAPMSDGVRKNLELWAGCIAGSLPKEEYLGIIRKAGFVSIDIASETQYDRSVDGYAGLASITVKGTRPL